MTKPKAISAMDVLTQDRYVRSLAVWSKNRLIILVSLLLNLTTCFYVHKPPHPGPKNLRTKINDFKLYLLNFFCAVSTLITTIDINSNLIIFLQLHKYKIINPCS